MSFKDPNDLEEEARLNARDDAKGAKFNKRPRTGRTGRDGQEAIMKLDPVKKNLDTLVDLHKLVKSYQEDLNNGIKETAEAAGVNASVVKKYIVAKAGENFADKVREIEQLAFIFEVK